MKARYERNFPALSEEEFDILRSKHVSVIGCGGLGGFIIEYLARIGIGAMTLVDGDVFEESNLNRQLYSSPDLLGTPKAQAAADRVQRINSDIRISYHKVFLDESNAVDLISGSDIVIDALDSPEARITLAKACGKCQIPMIHGAVSGWSGQIAVVMPGSHLIDNLYAGAHKDPGEVSSVLSFVPAHAASLEVAEAVKYLCGKPTGLTDQILFFDLLVPEIHLFDTGDLSS